MKKLDLWTNPNDGQKEDLPIPKGNTWFAHPVYFINHLDKAGLLDKSFNPYEGGGVTTGGVRFECEDNPGFAPVWTDRHNEENDKFRNLFMGPNGTSYARVTVEFKRMMTRRNNTTYLHEGIDFRGNDGDDNNIPPTPIHALIPSRVVIVDDFGGRETYGRFMLLQSETNKEYYYLLAHLSRTRWILPTGTIVNPGDTVAYVGNTGNSFGAHLHLSFLKVHDRDRILNNNKVQNIFAHAYNPFVHNEKHS
jgi:murein DD-endopeptidase MepM/ murein hydrolase activator NlpD